MTVEPSKILKDSSLFLCCFIAISFFSRNQVISQPEHLQRSNSGPTFLRLTIPATVEPVEPVGMTVADHRPLD